MTTDTLKVSRDMLTTRVQCPACGSQGYRKVAGATAFNRFERFPTGCAALDAQVRDARELRACTACGLWFFNIVPTPRLLRSLLDTPSLLKRWGGKSDAPAFSRARAALYDLLINEGSVMDIGAHSGGFLDTLGPAWQKAAVEPMTVAAETIGATKVFNGFLEEVDIGIEAFDCITAFDVLEHFYNPSLAMGRISAALRPGGIVVVETGSSDAVGAKLLAGGWYYVNHLEHLQVFNRASIEHLFRRAGLETVTSKRVCHAPLSIGGRFRSCVSVLLFGMLTGCGRGTLLWRWLNSLLRKHHVGSPPSTIGLEADHLFVVARRPLKLDSNDKTEGIRAAGRSNA